MPEEAILPERGPLRRARFTPRGGERNEQGTGGEGEGGGGKPCEWWQCGGPKGGAGESSNSHGKSFSISIYVSVIT